MYQKKTLRKMTPLARRLAVQANEAERHAKRLQRLVDMVMELKQEAKLDAAMLDADARSHALFEPCGLCGGTDKALDPDTLRVGCRSCGEWAA